MSSATSVGARTTHQERRLVGVDAARGVALLGMMAVHLMPEQYGTYRVGWAHALFDGRASALFALLAGVGIALGSGGRRPPAPGAALTTARRRVAVRAAVIAVLGLLLGGFSTPVALILTYYGVLFVLALPVLGWSARRLSWLAGGAVLVAPALREWLFVSVGGDPLNPGPNLDLTSLAHPVDLLVTVLVTGYYPVVTWSIYLFAGMAVGRSDLHSRVVAARWGAVGAVLAGASWIFSSLVSPHVSPTSWQWLVGIDPHSDSVPDLVHTTGTSLLMLAVMLLSADLARSLAGAVGVSLRTGLTLLAAAGSMTLTLYSLHVVAVGAGQLTGFGLRTPELMLGAQAVIAIAFAVIWGSPARRGPLEAVTAAAVDAAVPR